MVANSIPQGQVKAGDKIVNDVKLTNIPSGRFDGQLRPYSQADVEKLRYALVWHHLTVCDVLIPRQGERCSI